VCDLLEPWVADRAADAYFFMVAMASLAFALAVAMSPALHAASASFTSEAAFVLPDVIELPVERGA